jgi:DNA-binding IclR family transcriptional regulator
MVGTGSAPCSVIARVISILNAFGPEERELSLSALAGRSGPAPEAADADA